MREDLPYKYKIFSKEEIKQFLNPYIKEWLENDKKRKTYV